MPIVGDYFRDVLHHLARINASLDNIRSTIGTAIQVNLSMVTIEESEVNKKLAAWAGIFACRHRFCRHLGNEFQGDARTAMGIRLPDGTSGDQRTVSRFMPTSNASAGYETESMADQRPDPDQLLNRVNAEEAKAKRGKLKIFFGASAGVGKTYAMLGAARQKLLAGVVIGIVETHGRMETEVMADGMNTCPSAGHPLPRLGTEGVRSGRRPGRSRR